MRARSDFTSIRSPAVAGLFYPADAVELRSTVSEMLSAASANSPRGAAAYIVPHAGYIYSGSVAAAAYSLIAADRQRFRSVVLIGPSHRIYLRGLAVPKSDAFATPLGILEVDRTLKEQVLSLPGVIEADEPHRFEHSLEVQLPFLQVALEGCTILPLLAGAASAELVATVIGVLARSSDTLVLASSDLSHYLDYERAREIDDTTSATILRREPVLSGEQACGAVPINGLLGFARERSLGVRELMRCNSGIRQAIGAASSVMGRSRFMTLSPQHQQELLRLAHESIARGLEDRSRPEFPQVSLDPVLLQPRSAFVTLRVAGSLRGCCGSIDAQRPLAHDVWNSAWRSAFRDPRFPPLTAAEWPDVALHISVLTTPETLIAKDEADLCAQLRPRVDGLILEWGASRATFLPSVWNQLPDPREYVRELKRKAGWTHDFWSPQIRVMRYQAEDFGEDPDTLFG